MRIIAALLIVLSAMATPTLALAGDPHPSSNPWTCHCDSAGNPHVHKGKSGR